MSFQLDVIRLKNSLFRTAADYKARYHIGESLLRTTGSFLEFVDAYGKFESHGFRQKVRSVPLP